MKRIYNALFISLFLFTGLPVAQASKTGSEYKILFIGKHYTTPPPLSLLEKELEDEGIKGAELSAKDGNLAGRLFKKTYHVDSHILGENEPVSGLTEDIRVGEYRFIIADLYKEDLLALTRHPATSEAVIFNIRETDDSLRTQTCQLNLFHLIPSRAMYGDALGQYLVWKRWNRWLLITGKKEEDRKFAAAMKRTAERYGAKIVEEREYQFEAGNRRMETGHQQIQTQMPTVTQHAPEHDVVVVADESEAFGLYMAYRTKIPRPVVGTQGMYPTAWHRSFEQYGSARLQKVYDVFANRQMTEKDYLGWLAVKQVVAFTLRKDAVDQASIITALRDPELKLAGYKGRPMNFRTWNNQLRQPVLLTTDSALISMSPIEGFLHPSYHTDTLGYDEPESKCRLGGNNQ